MKTKILLFGNPLVKRDSLVLKILPKLSENFPQIDFKEFDPTENLEKEIENGKLTVLDVAEGINKIEIIKDINQLTTSKIYSMHDFDLAFNLKLLKKVGKLKQVEIIAIPHDMKEKEAFKKVADWIENLL
jgi:Ni,Fe-hydrogenase maturation factor